MLVVEPVNRYLKLVVLLFLGLTALLPNATPREALTANAHNLAVKKPTPVIHSELLPQFHPMFSLIQGFVKVLVMSSQSEMDGVTVQIVNHGLVLGERVVP